MPTGYTASIYDDISFGDFVLNCARNFGALIHMREDSMKAEIKLREESNYYEKRLEEELEEFEKFTNMGGEEAFRLCAEANTKMHKDWLRHLEETKKKVSQLLSMRKKVIEWKPPTDDHVSLRNFMLSQIDETISFDCDTPTTLEPYEPAEWLTLQIEMAERGIEYAKKNLKKQKVKSNDTNEWIRELFESLGRGEEFKKLKTASW